MTLEDGLEIVERLIHGAFRCPGIEHTRDQGIHCPEPQAPKPQCSYEHQDAKHQSRSHRCPVLRWQV